MRWTDTQDIAIMLSEQYPDINPLEVRFTDLCQWVMTLDGFEEPQARCNEKILEAIQMAWLDEVS